MLLLLLGIDSSPPLRWCVIFFCPCAPRSDWVKHSFYIYKLQPTVQKTVICGLFLHLCRSRLRWQSCCPLSCRRRSTQLLLLCSAPKISREEKASCVPHICFDFKCFISIKLQEWIIVLYLSWVIGGISGCFVLSSWRYKINLCLSVCILWSKSFLIRLLNVTCFQSFWLSVILLLPSQQL